MIEPLHGGAGTAAAQAQSRELLLAQRLVQLEAELATIYGSRFWRLTAPIRAGFERAERIAARLHRADSRGNRRRGAADISALKQAVRARADAELTEFLAGPEHLALPHATSPKVSVLLVLFGQAELTFACLRAIARTVRIAAEVVIVDNGSSDRTGALLDRVRGARVVRNSENRHFVLGVNQAAAAARGDALLLLNNDATLREGALDGACATLFSAPDIGAVGGRIVLPDGSLQEAGSIIWNDGACLGYGRGEDPEAAEFQFVREVDYCSGAFLLLRRSAFEQLGGLDQAFSPAYYEETDFCMRLRASGWRVLYDPRCVVDHFEFASASSVDQALALQRRHRDLFVERHRAALRADYLPAGSSVLHARTRGGYAGRVLVIEDRVPFPSLGRGYPRSARILDRLHAEGWFVTLYPLLFPDDGWDEIWARFPVTMEVMLGLGKAGLRRFLQERAGYYEAIIVSRPHNMQIFLEACAYKLPEARIIYDAEAIFALREMQRMALSGTAASESRMRTLLGKEMQLASWAHTILTVSEPDADQFRKYGCRHVEVVGHALAPEPTASGHASRQDVLFVGALEDDPSPNTDSLIWFITEIMPRLDAMIGSDYRLMVAGSCRVERIVRRTGPRIRLLGKVADLTVLYESARLFIAPTRYAAGIPHKIHEAAARGVPVVATPLLAQQLGWQDEKELLTGGTAEEFAAACARLYRDEVLWHRLRHSALARVAADCDPEGFARRISRIMAYSADFAPENRRVLDLAPMPFSRSGRFLGPLARKSQRLLSALKYVRANGLAASGRRLAAKLRLRFGRRDYDAWVRLYDTLQPADPAAIAAHIEQLANRPMFSLIAVVQDRWGVELFRSALASVAAQIYPDWELLVALIGGDADTFAGLESYAARNERIKLLRLDGATTRAAAANAALSAARGDFAAVLPEAVRLRPHALYMFAVECDADPEVAFVYADEDVIDDDGRRRDPHFKPDWSPELLLAPDMVGGFTALRRSAAAAAGGYREGCDSLMDYDLLLRVADTTDPFRVRHVARVLFHRSGMIGDPPGELLRGLVADHLGRLGEGADIHIDAGMVRIAYGLDDPPLVSVIVPTRDHADLLRNCMAGLLQRTDYPRLEVLIVDNGSSDREACSLLRELSADSRVRVLSFPQPFNFSAMNNLAVAEARGEVVALLNNDIAIRDPHWLREMVSHALRPGVGAVGAKLYYNDGTIQHAGVVTGMMIVAGHPFRGVPGSSDGPHGRLKRVQAVSCVTAACMVVRRAVYEEVGGLDEVNLPVSYNDVDFCLRLRARGYRIVWTPHAELDHLESKTRGCDTKPENVERALRESHYTQRRWGAVLGRDPYYSPNLGLLSEHCELAFPPRIGWPWREVAPGLGA